MHHRQQTAAELQLGCFICEPGCIIAVPFRPSALFFSKCLTWPGRDFCSYDSSYEEADLQLHRYQLTAGPRCAEPALSFSRQGGASGRQACRIRMHPRTSPTDQVPIANSRTFELHTPPPALLLACLSIRIPSAGPQHRWPTRAGSVLPSAPTTCQARSGRVASLAVSVSLVTCVAQPGSSRLGEISQDSRPS